MRSFILFVIVLVPVAAGACPGTIVGPNCVIDLAVGTTTFMVPADWDNGNNMMECWGAGAGGSGPNPLLGAVGGGGGGSYAAKVNLTETPAAILGVDIGTGGTGGHTDIVSCEGTDGGSSSIFPLGDPGSPIVKGGGGAPSVGCSSPAGSGSPATSTGTTIYSGGGSGLGSSCFGGPGGGAGANHLGIGADGSNCGGMSGTGGAGGVGVAEGGSGGAGGARTGVGNPGFPGLSLGGGGGAGGFDTIDVPGGAGGNGMCRVTYGVTPAPRPGIRVRPFLHGWPW